MIALEVPFIKPRIALDYDQTFTLDRYGWTQIVQEMLKHFDVRFVTYRLEDSENNCDIVADALDLGIEVIYCNYQQKQDICAMKGWIPNIWIDDCPELIPTENTLHNQLLFINQSHVHI